MSQPEDWAGSKELEGAREKRNLVAVSRRLVASTLYDLSEVEMARAEPIVSLLKTEANAWAYPVESVVRYWIWVQTVSEVFWQKTSDELNMASLWIPVVKPPASLQLWARVVAPWPSHQAVL
jgi:hypothetical protein